MATKIVTKNSSTAGSAPSASDLVQGELAVNVVDKRLYTEDNAGNIVELGTNPLGEITANGGIALGDNDKATFGADDDLQIYSDGTNAIIKEDTGGSLYIGGADVHLMNPAFTEYYISAEANGAVTLRHDNGLKLATTATGIDVAGRAVVDGLTSTGITDNASSTALTIDSAQRLNIGKSAAVTGNPVEIQANSAGGALGIYGRASDNFSYLGFYANGANTEYVSLRASSSNDLTIKTGGANRLVINSTGIDVTGTATMDGLTLADGGDRTITGPTNNDLIINSRGNTPGEGTRIQSSGSDRLVVDDTTGNISFYEDTGTTAKLFWDASAESLGIGTSSPSAVLDIRTAQNTTSQFTSPFIKLFPSSTTNTTGFTGITYGTSTADNYGWSAGGLRTSTSADVGAFVFNFHNNSATGSERMRIDSSGGVLVGTTTSGIAGGTAQGINLLGQYGAIEASRSGNASLYLNRYTSDGKIAEFRKDGTAVGSVGTQSGRLTVGSNSASGVRFDGTQLVPMSGASISDNTITLGDAGFRFKDLYLSGGVYLGGTGAANKLDDYESGTWTPNLLSGTSITYTTTPTGSYTKIGKIVHISASIDVSNSNTADGSGLTIGGLPFSAVGDAMTFTLGRYRSFLAPKDSAVLGAVATSTYIQFFESNNNYILYSEIGSSGVLTFSGTYEAA